ncbi:MAG: carboxymethylenebutenolidase [Actinomycetota bacterium]|jgi:carboxymethylenebutenolidase|nr:carboxymethylenebutenolidase [Actinomycetota bacterium]
MGEIIEFPSNGSRGQGYLATPGAGEGPGVVVIQEWWGLVDHIKDVCDRLAAEGFTALAPDLYHGEATTEPDEAGKLMMSLNVAQATKDMGGAVDELVRRTGGGPVGVIGFCMGGGLALMVGAAKGSAVAAVVPFYGVVGWPSPGPDYANMRAAVQGHYATNDDFASPEAVAGLQQTLVDNGVSVEVFTYPGTEHAFFNDTRPEVYNADAATRAWDRALEFLRSKLG